MTDVLDRVRTWLRSFLVARTRPTLAGRSRPSLESLEARLTPSSVAYLSFGPTDSVVAGYTNVDLSPFDDAQGYGWTEATGLSTVQRSGPDPLHQKFVQGAYDGSVASFAINLDPGTYDFTFHLGDQDEPHSGVQVWVDGIPLDQPISTDAGEFFDRTYRATVADGVALIDIQADAGSTFALDGLDITPAFAVSVSAPSTLPINTPGRFHLTPSGSSGPYAYSYTFQDGTAQVQTTSSSVNHTYAVDGDYRVMLQVADVYGNWVTLYQTVSVTGASTFYVTPGGDDSNDGSAARPWATVQGPINHNRFGPGDQILFQGGVTFQGGLYLGPNLQGTDSDPVTIGSFGGGRATLSSPADKDGIGITDAGGVLIQGLDLVGPWGADNVPPPNAAQSGIYFRNTSGFSLGTVEVDDVTVTGYAGMAIQVYADSGSEYHDVSVTNSTLFQNYGSGLYIYSDWGQTYQLQNVYVGNVQVLQDQAIPGAPYPGFPLWLQNVDGGIVEHCVVWDNDLTTTNHNGGSVGIGAAESAHILFQYNESAANFSNGNVLDSGGFDFDGGTQYSIMLYNYSHDNDGEGFLLGDFIPFSGLNTGNVLRYNISQNDGRRNPYGGIILANGQINSADIYNNTVYVGPNSTGQHVSAFAIQDDAIPTSVHVRNNIFVTWGGAFLVSVATPGIDLQIQGNNYWGSGGTTRFEWMFTPYNGLAGLRRVAPDFEMVGGTNVALLADPQLVSIGDGGTVGSQDDLATGLGVYRMQPGSPVAGAGLDLGSLGVIWDPYGFADDSFLSRSFNPTPTDFFGNPFGDRPTWSMGVDQGS
jgi:hypothetical protein